MLHSLNIFHIKKIWSMTLKCDLNSTCVKLFFKETNINCFHLISFVQFSTEITLVANIQNKVYPFFSSIKIISPWTCNKIFLHTNKGSVFHVKKYSPNILLAWKNILKKIPSCSCAHGHEPASLFLFHLVIPPWSEVPKSI